MLIEARADVFSVLSVPHPFPYQGSKRRIAKHILPYFPSDVACLIEPFCGAGAISIAACAYALTESVLLNDRNKPLMGLWTEILERPKQLADDYERLWLEQQADRKAYFFRIRAEFNATHQAHHLLYLLARIVKGAVRYSADGVFNQSADNRRAGMKPPAMRKNIIAVSRLLAAKTLTRSLDFIDVVNTAKARDLVYMDPPYQGTSSSRDHRYLSGLGYDDFVAALSAMNDRNVSFIISYDGVTGKKNHGRSLPKHLSLKRLQIKAGRSSQATLLGGNEETIESLYLSPALLERLQTKSPAAIHATAREAQASACP